MMRKYVAVLAAVIVIALIAYILWPKGAGAPRASIVSAVAPADTSGFTRAEPGRTLAFPADHGPHDDYQTEWWYYTGNLDAETGEHFGYQLTFFRRGLAPPNERASRASDWAADQVYMAHFALTDVGGGKHYAFEKLQRGAAGLAGSQADPFKVWLEEWLVRGEPSTDATPYRMPPATLRASAEGVNIELVLSDQKGPILQGDHGYSRKGSEPGNASYYYSLPRIASAGSITVGGKTYHVNGLSWMDHEWSTSALGAEQTGWDWFSLQLDDNTELMVFQLRHKDGSSDAFSSGTLIAADGTTQPLGPQDFTIKMTDKWRSPSTGATYPAGWVIDIPSADLSLTLTPHLADQEMRVSYSYWEGAVKVEGIRAGQPVAGNGYVELTGYAASMQGEF